MADDGFQHFGESLIAAPKSVSLSEEEQKRYRIRKARDCAEREQLKAGKSKKRPTIEQMLADLIRVAEDPDTNPFHKFKSLSARRYQLYGHYPIEFVFEQWGQFEHAKQVAGLSDKPGTKAKKAATAAQSRQEHASRYLEVCAQPYVIKDPEIKRDLDETKLILSISDTHATFLDPFTWWCFLGACKALKPDIVYFNGDILEGSEISSFPKIPGWTIPLQLEFDFAREMFVQTREVVGKVPLVVWGAGNHGLDRLAKYFTQQTPALAGLRSMRFDKLVDLEGLDIHLSQGGTIASPDGTEDDKAGMLLYKFYRVYHGCRLGDVPALRELRTVGRSGQSGHVHRASLVYGTTEASKGFSWMSTPMGCTERAGKAYIKGPSAGWQKGFGIAFLAPGGNVRQYPVITDNGYCAIEGHIFKQLKDIKEQDPKENWLKDFKIPWL